MSNPQAPINLSNATDEQKDEILAFITPEIAKSMYRRIHTHLREDTYAWVDFPHLIAGNEGFFFDGNGIPFKYSEIYADPIARLVIDRLSEQQPDTPPAEDVKSESILADGVEPVVNELPPAEGDDTGDVELDTNELTDHSDMLTGLTFDEHVHPAKKSLRLVAFSIQVQYGDLQEQLHFNMGNSPLAEVKDGKLNFSVDNLTLNKDIINANGRPSEICALMGDYSVELGLSIYGVANSPEDAQNLDATEPSVTKVFDAQHNDVTSTEEGQRIAELFRFSYVIGGTLEEFDAEPAAEPEAEVEQEPIPVLCIPSWQRFIPRHEWTPALYDLRKVYGDSTVVQLRPYVTIENEQGPLFAFDRGDKDGVPYRALGAMGRISVLPQATEGQTAGQALDELLITEAIRMAKDQYGYDVPYADMKQAMAESFPIYAPVTQADAMVLGISLTVKVKDASVLQAVADRTLINPMWIAREYANLHMHVATMVKHEHLSWKFETWAEVYLKTTMSPDVKQVYINNLKHIQFLFYRQRVMLDKLQEFLPPGGACSNMFFRQRIEKGTTMEASFDGENGPWFTFSPPLTGLVDKCSVLWSEPESTPDGEIPARVVEFRFGSTLEGKAYSSPDLRTWTEIPLEAAGQDPVAEPEEASSVVEVPVPTEAGQVSPVYDTKPKTD